MSEKKDETRVNETPESTIFSDPAHFNAPSDIQKRGKTAC